MFTGLIEELAPVRRVEQSGSAKTLVIDVPQWTGDAKIGDSVAINGACLTVVARSGDALTFEAGAETLAKTNLGRLRAGDGVNLERALRVGDRLGGHFVQGHVDGVGHVRERRRDGEWQLTWFSCPAMLTEQMVPKGSIAVDGVSLTLVDVTADAFSVALIPHTLQRTTLGEKQVGSPVNLETDLLAKHVVKCLGGTGITLETLRHAGFLTS